MICVLDNIADMWVIENAGIYKGYYHILGGTLSSSNSEKTENLLIPSLIERINYASDEISKKSSRGVKRIIEIIKSKKIASDEEFINVCLEALGYIEVSDRSYKIISEHLEINKYENSEDKITDI